jgi:nucleoside-diphosphate-sugar epimerase
MKVLVTGGTGFIGKKLVSRLIKHGDKVRLLTRSPLAVENSSLLEIHECDLLTSGVEEIGAMLEGVDVLYHCAGQLKDTQTMRALHVEATRKLVEAAIGRIARWVQLSSVGVYGPKARGEVTEESMFNPCGEYEITKTESDQIVVNAADKGGFNYSIVRPSNVYGAGMTNRSLYALVTMIHRGLFFFIGKPGASANYIHVDNVAEALLLCGTMPQAAGKAYNLSDHRTMEAFVGVIAQSLGKEMPHTRVPEFCIRLLATLLGKLPGMPLTKARVDALTAYAIYSNEKIERELGYRHPVSMEDGLRELVGFWQRETRLK